MGVRTVLYARPGYGRSTPRPGRTVADGAADTAAVLDALGVDTFLNVGYSGGGPYALACDALLAERCLGTAVIAGIAPYTETGGSSPVRSWYEGDDDNRRALDGDVAGFRQAVDAFLADLGQVDEEALAAGATSEAERRFFARGWGAWVASYLRAAGASGGDGVADDLLASLRDWCVPLADVRRVTIWHGAEDQLVPLFHGEWLRDHLPHADLRRLDDEGHVSIAGRLPDVVAGLAGDHGGRRPVG
jgi:pimeloyl-ACP methyl ester carboxylesterase